MILIILKFINFRSNDVNFPSVTICPDYWKAYKTQILKKFNSSASEIRNLNFPKVENMTSYEFYQLVTYDLEEFLIDMFITTHMNTETQYSSYHYTKNINNHPTMVHYDNVEVLDISQGWITQLYKNFGRCYTFTVPKRIQKHGVSKRRCALSFWYTEILEQHKTLINLKGPAFKCPVHKNVSRVKSIQEC